MSPAAAKGKNAGVDPGISIVSALLISMGVVMSYSATAALALDSSLPPLFFDHLIGVALGLAAGTVAYALPATVIQRLAIPFWLLTSALLVTTLILGGTF